MTEKTIVIQAKIDQSNIDQQLQQLTQKLKNIQQQTKSFNQVSTGFSDKSRMGDLTKTFYGDFNKDQINNLREAFNLNSRKLESENRDLRSKQQAIKELEKSEDKMTQKQKDRVEYLKEEIKLVKERGQTLLRMNSQIQQQAVSMGGRAEDFGGTTPPPPGIGSRIMSAVGGWRGMTGIAGMAGGAMVMGGNIAQHRVTRNREMLMGMGEQANVANVSLANQMAGQGSRNIFELSERRQAMEMAMKERSSQGTVDIIKSLGSILGQGAAGAGVGALAGSVVPGLGTAVGAVGGGILGVGRSLTDPRTFNRMFDQTAYTNTLNTEAVKNYERNLSAQKALNPGMFLGQDAWQQGYQGFQGMERGLGLGSTEQLIGQGGFYERNQTVNGKARFSRERIEQAVGELMNQGATGEYTKGSGAKFVSQLQQMGLTNAGSAVGKISGLGMGAGQTDDMVKKLIAEAMQIGIDKSAMNDNTKRFSVDMRRLLEIDAELLRSSGGAQGAVTQFQAGVTGAGGSELGFAQSAFERRSSMAGEGTGYRGALKWSFMRSKEGKEIFGGVSEGALNWVASANLKNLNADDPRVQQIADEMGVSPDEALNRINKVQKSGMFASGKTDKARAGIQSAYTEFLGGKSDTVESRKAFSQSKSGRGAMSKFLFSAGMQEGDQFNQMSGIEATSFALGEGLTEGGMGATPQGTGNYGLPSGMTKADIQESSAAKDQLATNRILSENLDRFADAASKNVESTMEQTIATNKLTVSIDSLRSILEKGGSESEVNSVIQQIQKQASGVFGDPARGGSNNRGR